MRVAASEATAAAAKHALELDAKIKLEQLAAESAAARSTAARQLESAQSDAARQLAALGDDLEVASRGAQHRAPA